MKRKTKLYLGYPDWPGADKTLWEAAFEPGTDLFDDGGPGAHLAKRTLSQLQYTYGKFLYFLSVEHAELLKRDPADRVNADTIKEFAKWQPASCGSVTLSIYLDRFAAMRTCLFTERIGVRSSGVYEDTWGRRGRSQFLLPASDRIDSVSRLGRSR
jgi:hypothetical protein